MENTKVANESGTVSRVLIVDDEPEIGRAVSRLLKHEGFETAFFDNANDALEAISTNEFGVILSDIAMPNMDGIELMRRIRKIDFDIPIILLTGDPTLDTAQKAIELGAYRYFTKPLDTQELVGAVKNAAFSYHIAKINRRAAELQGNYGAGPKDLLGLCISFDAALSTLWMAYQPIVNAGDGTLYAYEALMRTSSKTLPHPGAVLDAAETLGKLDQLGRKIREIAAKPLMDADSATLLFLNLHPADLEDPLLLDESSSLAPFASRVVMEITERASLEKIPGAMKTIAELRKRGFRIAVDDLGSGYSGLNSFTQLEPDIVKIDMAIIRDVDKNPTKQKLMRSVTDLCHGMDILVVAEGVETLAEREMCTQLGADLLQGYFIAKPAEPFPPIHW